MSGFQILLRKYIESALKNIVEMYNMSNNINSIIRTIKAKTAMVRVKPTAPCIAITDTPQSTIIAVLLTSQTQLYVWYKGGYSLLVLQKQKPIIII